MRPLCLALLLLVTPGGVLRAATAFSDPIYGVATTSNIVYGTGLVNGGANSLNLLLDLYRPTDIGGGALPALSPGIVLVHGGGFVGGGKSSLSSLAQTYATYGYTVVSIDYRLLGNNVPETHGPADAFTAPPPPFTTLPDPQGAYAINAAVEDASKAVLWMRANAGLYDVDVDHIAIGGTSAGAITSLLQAYNDQPAGAETQAVLSFLGAMYGTENVIQAGDVPAFVVASSNDTTVPFDAPLGTQAAVNRMNDVGVYNEFYVQSIGHSVNFSANFGGQTLLEHNIEFLANYLVPEPSSFVLAVVSAMTLLAFRLRASRRTATN